MSDKEPAMKSRSNGAEYSDIDEDVDNNNMNNNVKRSYVKPGLPRPHMPSSKKVARASFGTVMSAAFSFACVFYSIYTTMLLVNFLSGNGAGILGQMHAWTDLSVLEMIVQDLWLLVLFVTQHTVMAKSSFKHYMSYVVPEHLQRACYVLFTGIAIQLVTSFWVNILPDRSIILWDYASSDAGCITCQVLHTFAWMYTFAVVFMLDFSEFLGLKQVYYHANNFGCPMHSKSLDAQRFFKHFRHASVTGLLVVFWMVPCMTLDRLLLASVLTVYLFSTNVDHEDALYVRTMYKRKVHTLHHKSD